MFQRIKRMYNLSKKDPKALDNLLEMGEEELAMIPDAGDGKAEFFGEGTAEEFKRQEESDKGFIHKVFGL